jgi:hypothetical protein
MCFQSSPMTLMHLVSGPHFENHCFGTGSQSCVHVGSTGELGMSNRVLVLSRSCQCMPRVLVSCSAPCCLPMRKNEKRQQMSNDFENECRCDLLSRRWETQDPNQSLCKDSDKIKTKENE